MLLTLLTLSDGKTCQMRHKESLSKFKQVVAQIIIECKHILIRSKEPRIKAIDQACLDIQFIIESQNYLNYPWIYTAYTLTQTNLELLDNWYTIILLHCQLIDRNLTAAELEKITHYWLGSKGLERFI